MHDVHRALGALRRPPLLVRAARLGADGYRRETALPPLIGPGRLPPVPEALARLLAIERAQETARRDGGAGYRAADHVAVLIAVTGEARLLAGAAQENASGIDSLRRAT